MDKKKYYKLPSKDEIVLLKSDDNTHIVKENLFKLQVNEVLNEIQSHYNDGIENQIKLMLNYIKEIITNVKDQKVTKETSGEISNGMFIRQFKENKEIELSFSPPNRIDIIGSYLLKTDIQNIKNTNIDISIEIPKSCFLNKDFLNYKYFDKRNLYLGVIAQELNKNKEKYNFEIYFSGKTLRKPMITIKSTKYKTIPSFNIIPVIGKDLLIIKKLIPYRNNIKIKELESENKNESFISLNTAHYNNDILQDMLMREHLNQLYGIIKESIDFKETILLSKLWLYQNGLLNITNSLNGFLVSMILLYLVQIKLIILEMSREQMFKIFINFLVNEYNKEKSFFIKFPFIPSISETQPSDNEIIKFKNVFQLCFLDSSHQLNLFANLSKDTFNCIQKIARKTKFHLDNGEIQDFRSIFLQKNNFWTQFDYYLYFNRPEPITNYHYTNKEKLDIENKGIETYYMTILNNLLKKALGDRIQFICSTYATDIYPVLWNISQKSPIENRKLIIGLIINPENISRELDKGPLANDKEKAKSFREFWKDKASIRRFRDGSILETVLWERNKNENISIIEKIIKYICPIHLPYLSSQQIICSESFLTREIINNSMIHNKIYDDTTFTIWKIFHDLSSQIRECNDKLPLKIADIITNDSCAFNGTGIMPIESNYFSYSSSEKRIKPFNKRISKIVYPIEILLLFEKSSKWPDHLEAIYKTKTAFYVQLIKVINNINNEKNNLKYEMTHDFIDFFIRGYVFRLKIYCEKELILLNKTIQMDESFDYKNRLFTFKRENIYRSRHCAAMNNMRTYNKMFSPIVRFTKKWLDSNCLYIHLPDEIIELLVSFIFLKSNKYDSNPTNSFLSGWINFMKLIVSYHWENSPLFISFQLLNDFNIQSDEKITKSMVEKKFKESFKHLNKNKNKKNNNNQMNHPAMFIATDYEDNDYLSSWSKSIHLDKIIVHRLQFLCEETLHCVQKWLNNGNNISNNEFNKVFCTFNDKDYDILLHFNTKTIPYKSIESLPIKYNKENNDNKENEFSVLLNKKIEFKKIQIYVDLDISTLLYNELKKEYSKIGLFFMKKVNPKYIAIKWRPHLFLPNQMTMKKDNETCMSDINNNMSNINNQNDTSIMTTKDKTIKKPFIIPNIFNILINMNTMGKGVIKELEIISN